VQAVKYNFPHRLRKGATLVFSELLDSSGSLKVVQGAMGQTCRHTHHTYKSKHRQLCTDAGGNGPNMQAHTPHIQKQAQTTLHRCIHTHHTYKSKHRQLCTDACTGQTCRQTHHTYRSKHRQVCAQTDHAGPRAQTHAYTGTHRSHLCSSGKCSCNACNASVPWSNGSRNSGWST
jgi:hypothetical protein